MRQEELLFRGSSETNWPYFVLQLNHQQQQLFPSTCSTHVLLSFCNPHSLPPPPPSPDSVSVPTPSPWPRPPPHGHQYTFPSQLLRLLLPYPPPSPSTSFSALSPSYFVLFNVYLFSLSSFTSLKFPLVASLSTPKWQTESFSLVYFLLSLTQSDMMTKWLNQNMCSSPSLHQLWWRTRSPGYFQEEQASSLLVTEGPGSHGSTMKPGSLKHPSLHLCEWGPSNFLFATLYYFSWWGPWSCKNF